VEENDVIKAYIPENSYNQSLVEEFFQKLPSGFGKVSWEILRIEQQNWNAEWESHFNPVVIDDEVLIRASFHENLQEYPYQITIDPKMSFGTGHHSTTALMIKYMKEIDFRNKRVLDMGSGTGILAIFAKMLGASEITAIDIDEWAVANAAENFKLNDIPDFELLLGGAESIPSRKFDIILANINLNILIEDMPHYSSALLKGGTMVLSGIYKTDLEQVRTAAEQNNLTFRNYKEKNTWIAAVFAKE
jgi:ribosomal protein L11 methyltransferase